MSITASFSAWWHGFGRSPRIMGLDVARALAVLGMVGAHIGVTETFDLFEPGTWLDLVHGRSSILFAVLAGVSIALMTGRGSLPAPERMPVLRLNLLGRGAAIFVIGLLLELLNTPIAVILTVYGILYVAAIPFLRWSVPGLLVGAGVLALTGPPLLAGLAAVTLGAHGPGLDLVVFGPYPITVWMAFVLAGLALGRLRLSRTRTAATMLIAGILVSAAGGGLAAAGTGLGVMTGKAASIPVSGEKPGPGEDGQVTGAEEGWAGYAEQLSAQAPVERMLAAVFDGAPHSGAVAEILGSGGFAVAVIGLCLLLSRPLRWVLLPLAALGSMPLTAYSGHIVAIVLIAGPLEFLRGNAEWAWFSIALVAAATAWAALVGRGPLERLVGRAAEAMASVPAHRAGRVPKVEA